MQTVSSRGKISASFVDFSKRTDFYDAMLNRDLAFWRDEMRDMRAAGIEDVVVARTVLAGRAHYQSALLEEWDEQDPVALVMQAANEQGMGVMLGLTLNLNFWDRTRDFGRMMRRDLNLNRHILGELLAAHAGNPALRGIYVTHEPDQDNVSTPERANVLRAFLGSMYEGIKEACGKPVFCSPFFAKSLPPAELAAWWSDFVDRPMFDIIAMQDGVGCVRGITPDDIPPVYEALAPVFAAKGIRFWNNVETFTIVKRGEPLIPAPLERIARQYERGAPFVERTITWEYGHFLGRQQVSQERYDAFRAWNSAGPARSLF